MATPFQACRCRDTCRQESGFRLIYVSFCNALSNNIIKKIVCIILMQRLGLTSFSEKLGSMQKNDMILFADICFS
jgi:hypothetical protein